MSAVHWQIGHDPDAARTADRFAGYADEPGLNACAPEQIDRGQRFDFLEAFSQ